MNWVSSRPMDLTGRAKIDMGWAGMVGAEGPCEQGRSGESGWTWIAVV